MITAEAARIGAHSTRLQLLFSNDYNRAAMIGAHNAMITAQCNWKANPSSVDGNNQGDDSLRLPWPI